jgi:hypothetical protein
MPAPLSVDLRQRILAAYEAKGEMGTVQPKPHGGGAVAKLGQEQLPIVEALVKAQPDALLIELCERFA